MDSLPDHKLSITYHSCSRHAIILSVAIKDCRRADSSRTARQRGTRTRAALRAVHKPTLQRILDGLGIIDEGAARVDRPRVSRAMGVPALQSVSVADGSPEHPVFSTPPDQPSRPQFERGGSRERADPISTRPVDDVCTGIRRAQT